jgi:hypothetical protein
MRHDPHRRRFQRGFHHDIHWKELRVAKQPNYDFEKRRKELERTAKKDRKREDKLLRKSKESQTPSSMPDDVDVPPTE